MEATSIVITLARAAAAAAAATAATLLQVGLCSIALASLLTSMFTFVIC